jgi:hypothetical protein
MGVSFHIILLDFTFFHSENHEIHVVTITVTRPDESSLVEFGEVRQGEIFLEVLSEVSLFDGRIILTCTSICHLVRLSYVDTT